MKHGKQSSILDKISLLKHSPLLILFCLLLFGAFFVDLATPDREISEMENTKLQQRPTINMANLTPQKAAGTINNYFTSYNTYTKDQVFGRDALINAYGFAQTALFQKKDLGGIYLGQEDMMFPRALGLLSSEETTFPNNLNALEQFAQAYPDKITFLLAPTASIIYPENLPANAPLLDTSSMMDTAFETAASAGVTVIDPREVLTAHKDEYLYYRTDHHWTTLGAYYAYELFCEHKGFTPFDPSAHSAVEVPDFYGTHYAKARTWNAKADTITYYPLDNALTIYKILPQGKVEPEETTGVYNLAKFEEYDKYAAFMQGNPGFSRLEGNGEGKLLILKDSYANSFTPYLTEHYASIDVLDYRFYAYGLDGLIEAEDYDDILILYNVDSFKSDANFKRVQVRG